MTLLLTLQGCIGMETIIRFETDGRGTALINYRVSQFVTKLGTGEGERGRVPLPVSETDFQQAVSTAPGVSVTSVKRSENEEDIRLETSLRFDRIESLNAVRGFESMPATLTREAGRWVFRQVVSEGARPDEPIDAESLEMVRTLFADYNLTFKIEAPAAIRSASLGDVSGNTATYIVAIADLLQMTERTVLEVVW